MAELKIWDVISAYYITSSIWRILTFASIFYIVASASKESRKKLLLTIGLSIVCVLNEASYRILLYIVEDSSYYRFLWTVPYLLIVSYGFIKLCGSIVEKYKKSQAVIIIITLSFVLVGTLYSTQGNYLSNLLNSFPQNKYLVDDDIVELRYLLDQERECGESEAEPTLATPWSVMIQYQTVDAGCYISTNRHVYYYYRDQGYDLDEASTAFQDKYLLTTICEDSAHPDIMQAKAAIIREKIDYIVVYAGRDMEAYMDELDCSFVGNTTNYLLYRVNNNHYDSVLDLDEVQTIIDETGISIREIQISLSDNSAYNIIDGDLQGDVYYTRAEDVVTDSSLGDFLILNDVHSFLTTDSTTENYYETIEDCYNMFQSATGVHSEEVWQSLSSVIDYYGMDGVIFAGDMVDYASTTNYQLFQIGLDNICTPIMYCRADHDTSAWYNDDGTYTSENALDEQLLMNSENMTEYSDLMVWEYDSYYVLGWNNSCSQMTEEGLERAKEVFDTGKPIILVTHVPLDSQVDDDLYYLSIEYYDKTHAKLWGGRIGGKLDNIVLI